MFLSIPSSVVLLSCKSWLSSPPPPEDPGVLLHGVGDDDVDVVAHVVVQNPTVDRHFATSYH